MTTQNEVIKYLMLLAQLYQRPMAEDAAEVYLEMIGVYPPDVQLRALKECVRKNSRFPLPAEIIAVCEGFDGRPKPEEAWAMIPKDECGSVVWTDEMSEAFGSVYSLLDSDEVAARMAFKEVYERKLNESRASGKPPRWSFSPGRDRSGRKRALLDAAEKGRITLQDAVGLMPELEEDANIHPKIAAIVKGTLTDERRL